MTIEPESMTRIAYHKLATPELNDMINKIPRTEIIRKMADQKVEKFISQMAEDRELREIETKAVNILSSIAVMRQEQSQEEDLSTLEEVAVGIRTRGGVGTKRKAQRDDLLKQAAEMGDTAKKLKREQRTSTGGV